MFNQKIFWIVILSYFSTISNFYDVFSANNKLKIHISLNWETSNLRKNVRVVPWFLFKIHQKKWATWCKIDFWSYFWKIRRSSVILRYDVFFAKKWESPVKLMVVRTTKTRLLQTPKNSWIGYNFRGGATVQYLLNASYRSGYIINHFTQV